MSQARDLPDAIQWHEGMLLAPQHFQQAAQRQEGLLSYHAAAQTPFYWGIRQLEIDQDKLVAGLFWIRRLEAVMPDGLLVTHFDDDPGEISLDLSAYADEMRRRHVTVHLAVAASIGSMSAVSGEMARYQQDAGRGVVDSNTGRGELAIPRLRPRMRLMVTDEVPKKFVSLPLARVHHSDESFSLTTYEPPRVQVPVTSTIGQRCQEIVQRLRAKAVFLADQAHSPLVMERQPLLLETQQQVHSLVAALPHFEALLNSNRAHPFDLYLSLCNLVGQAASIGHSLIPPVFEPYDHNDLGKAFETARRYLFQVLDEGINETYLGIPLQWEDGSFQTYFEEAWLERKLILGVRGRHSVPEETTVRWMQKCLIGSESRMPRMRHHRTLGAERQAVDGDADLVPPRGIHLYRLQCDTQFMLGGEHLQVVNLDDRGHRHRPDAMILYVRNEG